MMHQLFNFMSVTLKTIDTIKKGKGIRRLLKTQQGYYEVREKIEKRVRRSVDVAGSGGVCERDVDY